MRYVSGFVLLLVFVVVGCAAKSQLSSGANSAPEAKEAASDATTTPAADESKADVEGAPAAGPGMGGGSPSMAPGTAGKLRNMAGETMSPVPPSNAADVPVAIQRAVIRRGALTVRVKNVEQAEKSAGKFVTQAGGYVEGTESNDLSSDQARIKITVRVPVRSFDAALAAFEGLGTRTDKTISGEDVTGKILDYDARLKTMRAQEDVYRGLLRQSRNLEAVITMQQKLMELREQIEGTTAQLKGLSELSSLSTIELTLSQSMEAVANRPQDTGWAQEAWAQAKGAGFAFYKGVVIVIMWLVVFCPVWVAALLLLRWLIKSAAPKPRAQTPPPPPMQL